MTNPFDDEDSTYAVLVNDAGEHSLWPASIAVPEGWYVTHGPSDRAACLAHINANWLDLRPRVQAADPR